MPSWRDFLKKPARRSGAQSQTGAGTGSTQTDQAASSASTRSTAATAQATAETEKPVETPASKSATEKPAADKQDAPPADAAAEPADEPAANPAEKPADKPAAQSAEKPAERPAKKEAPVAKTTESKTQSNTQGSTQSSTPSNKAEKQEKEPGRGRETGKKVLAGANALRARIASIVWLVAVICAATLAVGALIYALGFDKNNAIVHFILNLANAIDFGKFKDFTGKNAATKEHLTDWGIAAVIYLVVGKILDRIIRP